MDDNRYNAGQGSHLITLKRSEKARNLANKLPGMVEALASKTVLFGGQEKGTMVVSVYLLCLRCITYSGRKERKNTVTNGYLQVFLSFLFPSETFDPSSPFSRPFRLRWLHRRPT